MSASCKCKIIINLGSYWVCGTRRTPSYSRELHAQSSNINRVVVLVASKCKVLSLLLGSGVRLYLTASYWYCLPINVGQGKSREVSNKFKKKILRFLCPFPITVVITDGQYGLTSLTLCYAMFTIKHGVNNLYRNQTAPCYVVKKIIKKNVSTNYLHFLDCKEFILVTSL